MSSHDDFDESAAQRTNNAPYTPRHPIPTVQRYRDNKEERQAIAEDQAPSNVQKSSQDDGDQGLLQSTKKFLHVGHPKDEAIDEDHPYKSGNRNVEGLSDNEENATNDHRDSPGQEAKSQDAGNDAGPADTSEAIDSTLDPRQKRKNMKHMKRDHALREVTDPVTHLKVQIHDSTETELHKIPENEPPPGSDPKNTSRGSKSESQLGKELEEQQVQHNAMQKLFPPPSFDSVQESIRETYSLALTVGLCVMLASATILLLGNLLIFRDHTAQKSWLKVAIPCVLLLIFFGGTSGAVIYGLRGWLDNKIKDIWDDAVWTAARQQEGSSIDSPMPESTQWLNSLLSSVWALINPDLFTSLADTLEDVMQASLPKLVRMISVEDLGQGNESIRILGVRWLPTGAAAQSVSEDGEVKSGKEQNNNDRKVPDQGEIDDVDADDQKNQDSNTSKDSSEGDKEKQGGEDQNIAEGMEAEEGDFVNVEIAFSYRASKSGKSIKTKSRNAHIFLAFYLPGGIRFRKLISPSKLPMLLLIFFSCLGGASRDGWDCASAPSTLS